MINIQDIVTRYAHGRGFHVERRFGWDTHGLPVEYEIDKKLGITVSITYLLVLEALAPSPPLGALRSHLAQLVVTHLCGICRLVSFCGPPPPVLLG